MKILRFKFFIGSLPIEVDGYDKQDAIALAITYRNAFKIPGGIKERDE